MQIIRHFRLKDYLISVLIITVSLLYFTDYYLIPKDIQSVTVFGLVIDDFGFGSIYEMVYYSKMKLLILFFSITWYLTCRHWWKTVILVIIIIELFKLATVLNPDNTSIDDIEFITTLPITIPIITLLFFISVKINKIRLSDVIRNELDREIDNVFFELNQDNFIDLEELKIKAEEVKESYYKKDRSKYIKELILIRDKFYKL